MTRRSFAAALLLALTAACSRGPTATEGNVIGAWRSDAQNVGTVTLPTGPASATTFEMRHYRPNGSYLRTVYITGVTMNRSWVAAAEEGTWSLRDGALVTTTVNAFYAPDPAHAQDSPTRRWTRWRWASASGSTTRTCWWRRAPWARTAWAGRCACTPASPSTDARRHTERGSGVVPADAPDPPHPRYPP